MHPIKRRSIVAIASGFGLGFIPKASGTFATAATIPLYFYLQRQTPSWIYPLVIVLLFTVGVYLAGAMEQITRRKDPRTTVIDEVVGFLLTMLWLPPHELSLLLGFVLFRLFDIIKPPPISTIDQKVPGGLGVMLDDAAAALMANLLTRLLLTLSQGSGI